ncbi:hypothetical protein F5B19DRAFT_404315 [Rostrohypoxylon terebratum]|nr:hypothetical protein F5B19DRAFT_404315 [Rostrohypoxylon terebratum]
MIVPCMCIFCVFVYVGTDVGNPMFDVSHYSFVVAFIVHDGCLCGMTIECDKEQNDCSIVCQLVQFGRHPHPHPHLLRCWQHSWINCLSYILIPLRLPRYTLVRKKKKKRKSYTCSSTGHNQKCLTFWNGPWNQTLLLGTIAHPYIHTSPHKTQNHQIPDHLCRLWLAIA